MLFRSLFSLFLALSSLFAITAAKKQDEDVTAQALRDMQAGMAGLKEAASNPAMLAQLMRDLQVSAKFSVLGVWEVTVMS